MVGRRLILINSIGQFFNLLKSLMDVIVDSDIIV